MGLSTARKQRYAHHEQYLPHWILCPHTPSRPPERRSNGIPNHVRGHHEGTSVVNEDVRSRQQE